MVKTLRRKFEKGEIRRIDYLITGLLIVSIIVSVISLAVVTGIPKFPKKGKKGIKAKKVKVAIIQPFTAEGFERSGARVKAGYQYGFEKVNEKGFLINGERYTFDPIYMDHRGKTELAQSLYKKAVAVKNVKMTSGMLFSSITLACEPLMEKHKIVNITPISVNPKITKPHDGVTAEYEFRSWPHSDQRAMFMANMFKEGMPFENIETVALYLEDSTYGHSVGEAHKRAYKKAGVKIVHESYYPPGSKIHKTALKKIVQKNPDLLHASGHSPEESGAIFKQAREVGIESQFTIQIGNMTPELTSFGGKAVNGLISYNYFVKDKDIIDKELWNVYESFEAEYGFEPGGWALRCIDVPFIMAKILHEAGKISGEGWKEAVKEAGSRVTVDGLVNDNIRFGSPPNFPKDVHNILPPIPFHPVKISQGEIVPIKGLPKW